MKLNLADQYTKLKQPCFLLGGGNSSIHHCSASFFSELTSQMTIQVTQGQVAKAEAALPLEDYQAAGKVNKGFCLMFKRAY